MWRSLHQGHRRGAGRSAGRTSSPESPRCRTIPAVDALYLCCARAAQTDTIAVNSSATTRNVFFIFPPCLQLIVFELHFKVALQLCFAIQSTPCEGGQALTSAHAREHWLGADHTFLRKCFPPICFLYRPI